MTCLANALAIPIGTALPMPRYPADKEQQSKENSSENDWNLAHCLRVLGLSNQGWACLVKTGEIDEFYRDGIVNLG